MIRAACSTDASLVRQLIRDAYGHYIARIGKPPGPMLDDYGQRIAASQAWVLEEAGQIQGVLVLEDDPDALLVDNVAVAPSAQGRGHGRTLMAFAEDEARRRGCGTLRLYTNALMTENLALYARLGFRETHRVSEKGYQRVYMERTLT